MKAEVGLLSRNIKMRGDDNSFADQYGSHLILTGSSVDGLDGRVAYS